MGSVDDLRLDAPRGTALEAAVSIAAPIQALIDLLTYRPLNWLHSFLRLSALEADAVATRLGSLVGIPLHRHSGALLRVDLGPASPLGSAGIIGLDVRWTSKPEPCALGEFTGRFLLKPNGASTTVTARGLYTPPPMNDRSTVATVVVVAGARAGLKRLLTDLKSAVEAQRGDD